MLRKIGTHAAIGMKTTIPDDSLDTATDEEIKEDAKLLAASLPRHHLFLLLSGYTLFCDDENPYLDICSIPVEYLNSYSFKVNDGVETVITNEWEIFVKKACTTMNMDKEDTQYVLDELKKTL